ncbi:nose resistant to fluoxetine protein 6-like [Onthophagus taurus]|uniref:nose resistant to fluoxetine protein 6-like n=1 Tax=Onthophagus taurus TaxID=166361 RepID=UPI0039BDF8E2
MKVTKSNILLTCFSLLVNLKFISPVETSLSSTPKYVSYNSSDLSYLSNGIQFPAPEATEVPTVDLREIENLSEMEWFDRLYDHHYWGDRVKLLSDPLCQKDMGIYLEALKNGTSWAAKMFDSSGRYNSQFFFGNDFWMGSSTSCWDLTINATYSDVSPFELTFYVIKVRININEELTPVTRQLNIGQCLPKSCKTSDVRSLLIQEKSRATSLSVVDVRPVPGDYSVLTDVTFYILSGISTVIIALIITATIVEIVHIQRKQNHESNNNLENGKGVSKSSNQELKTNFLIKLLLCFGFRENSRRILSVDRLTDESIKCIHGLRFFSIAWIILVHTYLEVFAIAENKTFRTVTERSFLYQTISNATFSVDTFFFISGLLVTILYFRQTKKKTEEKKSKDNLFLGEFTKFLMMVLYRFLRLTPAYLFVLGVNELVLKYSHNNSVFSPAMIDHFTCGSYWWRNALYINNFFPQSEFCMLWSWYIANDTQFYLLAILLLPFAIRSKTFKWVSGIIITFLITSWIATFIIAMQYNYIARVEEPFALFDQLYDKPWLRIGPYLIGMITGYFLFKTNGKLNVSFYLSTAAWIVSLAIILSLVYGLGSKGLTTPLSAVYAAFGHTAWGLSLAWITIACCWGYAGPISSILNFRGFLPLSRLTYCAYLIHPVIMVFVSFKMDGPIHIHNIMIFVTFLGNLVTSFMVSFLISVAYEAPIVQILKVLLSPSSSPSSKENTSLSAH